METRQVTSLSSCRQTIYRADKNTKKKKLNASTTKKKEQNVKMPGYKTATKKKGVAAVKKFF